MGSSEGVRRAAITPHHRLQDLWINKCSIRYDERPVMAVGIMEFRHGKVVGERICFGDR